VADPSPKLKRVGAALARERMLQGEIESQAARIAELTEALEVIALTPSSWSIAAQIARRALASAEQRG